jgi:hypothetical protein
MAPVHSGVAEGVVAEDLTAGIADLRTEMRTEFASVRGELREGLAAVRGDMREGFAEMRGDMREGFATLRGDMAHDRFVQLKWSFAFWLGQVFAIVGFLALLLRTVSR